MAKELHPLLWCVARALPAIYTSDLSYIETLSRVLDYIRDLVDNNNEFIKELDQVEINIGDLQTQLAALQEEIEKVKSGGYVSLYLSSIMQWIDDNLQQLVGRTVTFFQFGLTDDGRIYVDVPKTWQFLTFDWVMEPGEDFGKIALAY